MTKGIPSAPRGLQRGGRALWGSVTTRFELTGPEMIILKQACRTADLVDRLDQDIRRAGMLDYEGGLRRVVVEHRMQSLTLARLIGSLRLPDENDVRPQRRMTSRGTYQSRRATWYQEGPIGVVR